MFSLVLFLMICIIIIIVIVIIIVPTPILAGNIYERFPDHPNP